MRLLIITDTLNKYINSRIYYTDDECLLNLSFDHKLNSLFEVNTGNDGFIKKIGYIQLELRYYLNRNVKLRNELMALRGNPAIILNSVFNTASFSADLQLFVSNVENESIESRIWWNMSLFWNDIFQEISNP